MCLITFQGSILKETNPEYSLEGVMLKLKPWYSGHLMRKVDSLEKTLMLAKNGGRRRRDDRGWRGWMASLIQWTWVWANSGRWWRIGKPGMLQFMGSQRVRPNWATEQQHIQYVCIVEVPYICCIFVFSPLEIGKGYPPPLARELVVKCVPVHSWEWLWCCAYVFKKFFTCWRWGLK